jgi:hypothetical protein
MGYVKLGKNMLFHDKRWVIRARIKVNQRRPGRKDIRLTGQDHINNLSNIYSHNFALLK